MLQYFLNESTFKELGKSLREVDDEAIFDLVKELVKPFMAKAQKSAHLVVKAGVVAATGYALWWKTRALMEHCWNEYRWQTKSYLSLVSAQLLTTQVDQPKHAVSWVDKRTLFQKDLKNIGIIRDKHTQQKVAKAAEQTTPEDPFLTSFLYEGDSWYVLNAMVNELSSMAGLCHLKAMQGSRSHNCETDWYVIALMNPKYDDHVAREFIGGEEDHSAAARTVEKLRLVVVWERELWDIVCNKIEAAPEGMVNDRHKRRWALITQIAQHYKRYMGRKIMNQAAKDARAMEEQVRSNSPEGVFRRISTTDTTRTEDTRCGSGSSEDGNARMRPRFGSDSSEEGKIPCASDAGDDDNNEEDMQPSRRDGRRKSTLFGAIARRPSIPTQADLHQEISQELFTRTAAKLKIPAEATASIFADFDVNKDHLISLAEIDSSCQFKRARTYVDSHLMKVNLPLV